MIQKIKENPDKYGNLEEISNLNTVKNEIFAVNLFFMYLKLFKYLNFNRTMAQLNNTLSRVSTVYDEMTKTMLFGFSAHGIF